MSNKSQIVTKKTPISSLYSQWLETQFTRTMKPPPTLIEMLKKISGILEKSNRSVQDQLPLHQSVLTTEQRYLTLRCLTFKTKAETTLPFRLLNHIPTMTMSTLKPRVKQIYNQSLHVQEVVLEILPQLLASANSKKLFSRLQLQLEGINFMLVLCQASRKPNTAMKS